MKIVRFILDFFKRVEVKEIEENTLEPVTSKSVYPEINFTYNEHCAYLLYKTTGNRKKFDAYVKEVKLSKESKDKVMKTLEID